METKASESPLVALRQFFNVSLAEMSEFWKACTDEEKTQFKAEIARWDGHSEFIA